MEHISIYDEEYTAISQRVDLNATQESLAEEGQIFKRKRFKELVQFIVNQPGAEDSTLKHFDNVKPSGNPSDYSKLEGYEVREYDNGTIYQG